MTTRQLPRSRFLDKPALALIALYQTYLSPHKGFRCAFRTRHGGPSCSSYATQTIAEVGVARAGMLILERFAACSAAARELRSSALSVDRNTDGKEADDRDGCPCACCFDIGEIPSCSWI